MTGDPPPPVPVDRAPAVVIGVGNPMGRDDGVGPAVVEALADVLATSGPAGGCRRSTVAPVELMVLGGEATAVIEAWSERDLAIVVDAARGRGRPGDLHRLELVARTPDGGQPVGAARAALDAGERSAASTHGIGLASAVELGRVIDRLPGRLVVVGVEVGELGPGSGLSAAVAAAVPRALRQVLDELDPDLGPLARSEGCRTMEP